MSPHRSYHEQWLETCDGEQLVGEEEAGRRREREEKGKRRETLVTSRELHMLYAIFT
jgi:hypothetical protein